MNRIATWLTLMALMAPAALEAQAPPTEADAEDGDTLGPADQDMMEPEPAPVVRQPPPPPPPPQPVVVAAPPPAEDEDAIAWLPDTRPGASFGLGLGWTFPGPDLWTPNTIAARFRLKSGLTIEPSLIIRAAGANDGIDFTDDPRTLFIGVGAMLRMPLASAGPVDFLFLGTAGIGVSIDIEPGDSNTLNATLGYGLGLEFWLTQRFTIGMDATNALVDISWSSTDDGFGDTRKQTNWAVGVVWNPQLRLLATLYF